MLPSIKFTNAPFFSFGSPTFESMVLTGKYENYRLVRNLTEDKFGFVSLVERKSDGAQFAMKLYRNVADMEVYFLVYIKEERAKWAVQLIDAGRTAAGYIFTVSALQDGNMSDFIENPARRLSREYANILVYAMYINVAAMHALGIVHRDLHPENIFYRDDEGTGGLVLAIGDFGFACTEKTLYVYEKQLPACKHGGKELGYEIPSSKFEDVWRLAGNILLVERFTAFLSPELRGLLTSIFKDRAYQNMASLAVHVANIAEQTAK